MADYRSQIEEARKAGYSDDEIVQFLGKTESSVQKALTEGYSPQEVVGFLSSREPSVLENTARKLGIVGKAAGPAAIGTTAGALMGAPAGPPGIAAGAIAGGLAVPLADAGVMAYNALLNKQVRLPSEVIRNYLPGPTPQTPGERVLATGGEALLGVLPQVAAGRALTSTAGAGARAVGQELSRAPVRQIVAAPIAGATGQAVTEATDNPVLGLAAGAAAGGAAGLQRTQRELAPTSEQLSARAKANYAVLEQSGLQFNPQQFSSEMKTIAANLRPAFGYVAAAYPKVAAAVTELVRKTPKDVAELQALRKIIQGAKASADPQERLIASELMDNFDDYILNAPPQAVVGGNRQAVQAWQDARADYSAMKKSEIFEEMIDPLSGLTTKNKSRALTDSLQQLAKNKKRMRLFTSDEREEIIKIAKGGAFNSVLERLAKITNYPLMPVLVATSSVPTGATLGATGFIAKGLGGALRERDVNRLAAQMRLGRKPRVLQGAFGNVPVTASRNVLAPPYVPQQQEESQ